MEPEGERNSPFRSDRSGADQEADSINLRLC